jgi:hypothetical protein
LLLELDLVGRDIKSQRMDAESFGQTDAGLALRLQAGCD